MLKKLRTKIRLRRALVAEQRAKQVTHFDHGILDWQTTQYNAYEKGVLWYVIFTAVISLFIVYAFYSKDYFFAAAMIAFGVAYAILQREKPKNVKVILSKYGIKVGNDVYPYSEVIAFWLIYKPPYVKTLNFRIKNRWAQDLVINIHKEDPAEIREMLGSIIPEWKGKQEAFAESLVRLLRL
ncbi:MAG: hypothetical protein AAB551_02055 [Patescibacteria group bacterium]